MLEILEELSNFKRQKNEKKKNHCPQKWIFFQCYDAIKVAIIQKMI